MENKIYLTVNTLRRKYTSLFAHELTYMFVHHMKLKKIPKWLIEGLALYFSQPNLIKNISMRSLHADLSELSDKFFQDKRYLHFDKLDLTAKRNLLHVFLIVKYLIKNYGWDNMQKFCKAFGKKRMSLEKAIWETFHLEQRKLQADFDLYIIARHYFTP